MKKRINKFSMLLSSLILSVSLLLISSYSWFASFYAVQNIQGLFFYELKVNISESTENIELLEKSLPMSVNDAIEEVEPHEFIIEATGESPLSYYIIVLDDTPDNVFKINPDNVYYAVNVNGSPFYSVGTLTPNPSGRHLVYLGSMSGESIDTISLRLWLGPSATTDGAASISDPDTLERTYRYFEAKVIVEVD